MKTLIYLHGFNSSSQSHKATITSEWFAQHRANTQCLVPQLPDNPLLISSVISSFIDALPADSSLVGLLGSSMGGFFANYFSERLQLPAVLINPAVYPHKLLKEHLGLQNNPYTNTTYTLEENMIQPLQDLVVNNMAEPKKRMVLQQKGDEVLDYREAAAFYCEAQMHLEDGGNHSFQGYENWMPLIAKFFSM